MNNELKKLHEAERQFYLGKTDKVPGTDKTATELREAYLKTVDEANKKEEAARKKVLASLPPVTDEYAKPQPFTTAITAGVIVQIPVDASVKNPPTPATPSPTGTPQTDNANPLTGTTEGTTEGTP